MAFKVLLDVNVILDFTLKRKGYAAARRLIEWTMEGRIQAFVTPSIIQVVAYWLTKEYGSAQAKEIVLTLLADVQLIDIGHDAAVSGLHSIIQDIPEALSYYAALQYRLDYYISRDQDLSIAANPVLPVCTPEEFLHHHSVEVPD